MGNRALTPVVAALLVMCALPVVAQPAAGQAAVTPPQAQKTPDLHKVAVQVPLREGMRIVSGQVTLKDAPAKGAEVEVTILESIVTAQAPAGNLAYYAQKAKATADANGMFSVALPQPLTAMQRVRICVGTAAADCVDGIEVDAPTSWGRIRLYFAGGVVFSKQHGDFSQQDLALSFTLDKNWWQAIDRRGRVTRRFIKEVHTFFDTRLTSVPVSVTSAATTPAAGGSPPAPAGGLDTFLQSQKAAIVQAGLYLPIYGKGMIWSHDFKTNALFIAPVVKLGLATTAAAQTTTSATATTTTTVSTTSATNDVFRFYSAGFGVGHFRLENSSNNASELISYVHVTFGKWENFEMNRWRVGVEGRLKIPETPFQIGFDANVRVRGSAAGDLRFLLGARFDLGELIGKLRTF